MRALVRETCKHECVCCLRCIVRGGARFVCYAWWSLRVLSVCFKYIRVCVACVVL